jgi:hypothetical protein
MTIAQLPPNGAQEENLSVTSGVVVLAYPGDYDSINVLDFERLNQAPTRPGQYSVDTDGQTIHFFADDEGAKVVVRYWTSPDPGVQTAKMREVIDAINSGQAGQTTSQLIEQTLSYGGGSVRYDFRTAREPEFCSAYITFADGPNAGVVAEQLPIVETPSAFPNSDCAFLDKDNFYVSVQLRDGGLSPGLYVFHIRAILRYPYEV